MSGVNISKALYGTGTTTVDVTKSVMSHVKDGVINLVITPDSLNVPDPAPNQQKILDIVYTINGGKTMSQMVKDNEVLMISAPPKRDAVGLQITKAEYGYPGNFTDVTDAIQNHVRDGTIKIKVGPSTAGIPDPNPNKQKTLEVAYTINGYPSTSSVVDGKMLNISAPPIDGTDNKTPSQHITSVFWSLYTATGYFVAMFLYVLSIYASYDIGQSVGFGMPSGVIAAFLPYFAFWGLPGLVFVRRLFYSNDLVI